MSKDGVVNTVAVFQKNHKKSSKNIGDGLRLSILIAYYL